MHIGVTAMGSLLSAFLASLCCVGPLMLGVIGVGAGAIASAVKALVPYRPVFIALTLLLLAGGFFSAYRRKEACSTDPACPTRTTKALKVALWAATIAALILILLPDLLVVGV